MTISSKASPHNSTRLAMLRRLLLSWFGCGYAPKAPGSIGSLGALPPGVLFALIGGWPLLLLAAAIVFFAAWRATDAELAGNDSDPGWIVADEVVGQWIALAAMPLDVAPAMGLIWIIAAFALFRLFDIAKPWPVRWADRNVGGGLGVMLDDVLAGVYAAGILLIARAVLV